MRLRFIQLLASLVILTTICRPAAAQAPVSISISTGVGQNGAANATEAMMRTAGLDGSSTGWFSDELTVYPTVRRSATWNGADVRVRIRQKLSAGLFYSKSAPATTRGQQGDGGFNSVDLTAEATLTTIAPLVAYHPLPRIRLAVGPAIYRMEFNAPEASYHLSENKCGWSAHAGFAFLDRRRIFSEVTLQYLGAPGLTAGGFTLHSDPRFDEEPVTVSVPLVPVDYRRLAIGVSFGLKLG